MGSDGDDVPIRMLDAGPDRLGGPGSEEEVNQRLREAMVAARATAGGDEVVVDMVDLVHGIVAADAITLELRGPVGRRVPWLLAHRGLRPDEQERLTDAAWRAVGPDRFAHRFSIDLTAGKARPGQLTLWRAEQPFVEPDVGRARLAAATVETLLHQFLRRSQGKQRQRWLDAAEEFADALVAPDPVVEDVLHLVVDQVREVSGCDLVWLVSGTASAPVLRALSGDDPHVADLQAVDFSGALTTQVLATGEATHVTDMTAEHPRVAAAIEAMWPAVGSALGPAVVQPVLVAGREVGALGMVWRAERTTSYLALEPRLPEGFAARAALAIRIGQARADDERLAVLEERHRIRLDLHDRVVQRLYALGMALEAARQHDDRTSIGSMLDHAVERIDDTIAELRRTITGLSVAEDGLELYDAMVDVLDKLAVAAPFRPELRIQGLSTAPVPAPLADDLLSVLQEAVSNVVRHAGASRCRVTLEVDSTVILNVEDDGVGIPDGVVGSGLANLRHRATAHGGAMTLTRLDPGTRLTWSAPRPATAAPVDPGDPA